MCGRFTLFTDEEYLEIRDIINEVQKNQLNEVVNMKTGEIFPTNYVPVITTGEGNKREIKILKWGFPNFKQASGVIINARSETLEERPTFKNSLYTKRCIIPSTGFYEWKGSDKKKDKYIIKPKGHNFCYMAGLYNTYKDTSGVDYTAFVIITTEANDQMSTIHNRMPILMTEESEYIGWINPGMDNLSDIKSYLRPYGNELSIENTSIQLQFNI